MDKTDILTPLQTKVLGYLFSQEWFRHRFYLTGGTALAAFHLQHRRSDDLDFFTHGAGLEPAPALMREMGREIGETVESAQASPGFLRFRVGASLQVDLVADVDFRVGAPELIGGFMVDTIKNIAVNKVCAILGRLDAKDYVDLYAIFQHEAFDVFELLELGQKKDAGLDPFVWASLLAEIVKLPVLPRMVRPLDRKALDRFFLGLRDSILDRLKRTANFEIHPDAGSQSSGETPGARRRRNSSHGRQGTPRIVRRSPPQ
ncbi:MAG: nucleotidyl transferase AbiEii/AbiGii toxin family protein [Elusimicrobia bacterium]|nr:nucleotidyl transferase AbiEii/AbiGii toxin family protein [Elusimicrobiota bacterium]